MPLLTNHESHYCINVAVPARVAGVQEPRWSHFFRVEVTSGAWDFSVILASLRKNYPAPEYEITTTNWKVSGYPCNDDGTDKE